MPREKGDPKTRDRDAETQAALAAWQRVKSRPTLTERYVSVEKLMGVAERPATPRRKYPAAD